MCRSLLNDEKFVDGVALHLVKKLADTEKKITQTHQKPVGENEQIIRMTQLLEGLSVLCACKGKPLKSNQRMLYALHNFFPLLLPFHNRNHLEANAEEGR